MNFKLIGCILLIIGTCIGAGMLALPLATASMGFFGASLMLVGCWLVMTAGAYLVLEVNLWFKANSHLVSMARATLGPWGQLVTWIIYMFLLYSLLSAYIAGGSDLFRYILSLMGWVVSPHLAATLFTGFFGIIVLFGIRTVDIVNRGLMSVKLLAYCCVVLVLTPFMSKDYLLTGNLKHMSSLAAFTVTITSFGFATIVPSLRAYFGGDVVQLKRAIFWGSFLPLLCYLAWIAVVMGVLPLQGEQGLQAIMASPNSTSALAVSLTSVAQNGVIQFSIRLFTSICVVTSFLGVAISLVDFLADGLRLEKRGAASIVIHLLSFIPPYLIALFYPHAFIQALEYAGIYCLILLALLPALMAWRGRYTYHFQSHFRIIGGKATLILLIVFSAGMILRYLISS